MIKKLTTTLFLIFYCSCINSSSDKPVFNIDTADLPEIIHTMISGTNMEEQSEARIYLNELASSEVGLLLIIDQLESDNSLTRMETSVYIGYAFRAGIISPEHDVTVLRALFPLLADSDSDVRETTCIAIGDWKLFRVNGESDDGLSYTEIESEIIEAITILLEDPDSDVRVIAANTINYFGLSAEEVAPEFLNMLSDDDFLIQLAAAIALTQVSPDCIDNIPILLYGIYTDDQFPAMRRKPHLPGETYPIDINEVSRNALMLLYMNNEAASEEIKRLASEDHSQTGEFASQFLSELLTP